MIGENLPFFLAVSILSIIFILSFFHIYSMFLDQEKTVSLHRKGLAILGAFVKDYEEGGTNCSKWKNKTVINYNIESPSSVCGKIGGNISFNQTEKLIRLSSPILVENGTEIKDVNIAVWE